MKKYFLVNDDDPNERHALESNNFSDAYIEALEMLGYSVVFEEMDDEGSDD